MTSETNDMVQLVERIARSATGTAVIEFALAMIPLSILLAGGITYAGVFSMELALSNAANVGARAGIAGASTCERQELAVAGTKSGLAIGDPDAATISAVVTDSKITVTVSYPYSQNWVTPILFPIPDTLTTTAIALTDDPVLPSSSC
jgi:Flp pilus assembly protein TadG